MFINYLEYHVTGQITKVGCSQNIELQQPDEGGTVIALGDFQELDVMTAYAPNGLITPRPTNNATIDKTTITADGTDEAIITGISDPSTVTITSPNTESISETCTDGQVEFSATEPGEYTIKLMPEFPEQEKIFTVTAT